MAVNYSRSFIVLKQESPEYTIAGRTAGGKCLIEVRNGIGKVSFNVQNMKPGTVCRVYILSVNSEKSLAVEIGKVIPDNKGKGELKWECPAGNVGNTGKPIEDFNVAGILLNKSEGVAALLIGFRKEELLWRRNFRVHSNDTMREEPDNTQAIITENIAAQEEEPSIAQEEEPIAAQEDMVTEEETCEEESVAAAEEPAIAGADAVCEDENVIAVEQICDTASSGHDATTYQSENEAERKPAAARAALTDEDMPARENNILKFKNPPRFNPDENATSADFFEPLANSQRQKNLSEIAKKINDKLEEIEAISVQGSHYESNYKQRRLLCTEEIERINMVFRNCSNIKPFKIPSSDLKWIRITINELQYLPKEFSAMNKDDFVSLSFRKFNHLILGRNMDSSGQVLILGSPDIFHMKNEQSAKELGFEYFKCCDCNEIIEGKHGYWLKPMVIK